MKETKTESVSAGGATSSTIVAGTGYTTAFTMPSYDTQEPRPTIKYVKVKPKRIVIKCRCGGKLRSSGGMTTGWTTTWNNKCTKCGALYAMEERAGEIIYE